MADGMCAFFTQMGCYMPKAQLAIGLTWRHFKAVCFIGKASFCLAIDMGAQVPTANSHLLLDFIIENRGLARDLTAQMPNLTHFIFFTFHILHCMQIWLTAF